MYNVVSNARLLNIKFSMGRQKIKNKEKWFAKNDSLAKLLFGIFLEAGQICLFHPQ